MMSYDVDELVEELTRDEGREKFLYQDSVSKWTIGVGWNIQDNGLPDEIIDRLLQIGIYNAEKSLDGAYPEWRELSNVRQRVCANMMFNMGKMKFNRVRWPKFFAAVKARDWEEAGRQMQDSKWWGQVGPRAVRLRKMMEEG